MSRRRLLPVRIYGCALLLGIAAGCGVLAGCSGRSAVSAPMVMPGTIALAAATTTVAQSAGTVSVVVSRSGGTSGNVSVNYATADGSAVAGTDYTKASGSFVWNDGDATSRTITVPIATMPGFTGARAFTINLSGAANGASLGTASDAVSITGSGAPQTGTIALAASSGNVLQTVGTVTASVTRSGGSSGAVGVNYATVDGTAVAGTDYTAASGTLSWASGDTIAKSVTIPVSASPGFSGTRIFSLALSNATGGVTLGAASETFSITGSLIPPSSLFSFTFPSGTWKLQLPIDQFGGTGGTGNIQYASIEETTAQLSAGFVDAHFYADTATYAGTTNHIVFVAPSNGAVTTPGSGSDHTRSELRELYTGSGADSNSDWNSTIGGTLTANCVVQAVSVDSDEATIGQIHNQSYVFALMLYRPAQKDVAFDLYSSLGGSTHVRTSIVKNVNIGDSITYSMTYTGNTIAVTVNGTTQSFAVDSSWAGTPMYFKLGAYHAAPNIGNPAGDKTQVAFSSFEITH
jgi:Alginate lyase/Calx-beta domain